MTSAKRVLISGASIAGPALAWWLHRHGFSVVLVEKAPGPRTGGQAIDARGVALRVLDAMGLAEKAQARRTRMKGVSEHDADGNELWRSENFTISGGSFDLESVEILRDDLSAILLDALPGEVELIYGDSIATMNEIADGISVTFASGTHCNFDIVVGADGLASITRSLVFGPIEPFLRSFDFAIGLFSAPNTIGLEDWQLTWSDGGGSCTVYTTPGNASLRASFGFDACFADVPEGREAQLAMVRERCGHMRWMAPELLDAMDRAEDFYLGSFAHVKMDCWHKGRTVLVGDAAYCPSPYTGQGTSLALVGAYVLARELSLSPGDHAGTFARYEAKMRPYVDQKNQAIADITLEGSVSDPDYYLNVIEPAMEAAKNAIVLEGLG